MTPARARAIRRYGKPAVLLFLLSPGLFLAWEWWGLIQGTHGQSLGFNPVEYTIRATGELALRMLLITLAITPLVRLTGWAVLTSFRRMLGLLAFSYVVVHLTLYLAIDLELDFVALAKDVEKRIYITAGMGAFLLLLPLAITSTSGWIKRLGARRWQRLHQLVYLAAILGVVHFLFMVKGNQREPWIYAAILALLLGARVAFRVIDARKKMARRNAPGQSGWVSLRGR